VYPPNAVAGGSVVAALEIQKGAVTSVDILSGGEPFAGSVRQALAAWRFPSMVVRARVPVVVVFAGPNLLPAAPAAGDHARASRRSEGDLPLPSRLTEPVYPPNAWGGGAVTLRLEIDRSGAVRRSAVVRSLGAFTDAARAAIGQWRFTPARPGRSDEALAVVVFRPPVLSSR
jgi:TonB family protein